MNNLQKEWTNNIYTDQRKEQIKRTFKPTQTSRQQTFIHIKRIRRKKAIQLWVKIDKDMDVQIFFIYKYITYRGQDMDILSPAYSKQ